MQDAVIIVGMARTPFGNFLGVLKDFPAPQLGKIAIKAAIEKAGLLPEHIEEVIMGCVCSAGLGQAPARQAALAAGIPASTPCTTINKICGSGMKAVMFAHDGIIAQTNSIYVAGGMESMSRAPYLLQKARTGYRLGHDKLIDHMMYDGLEDAYEEGRPMGYFAEQCASAYGFTREEQDRYAISSFDRIQQAIQHNIIQKDIVPITIKTRESDIIITSDERPLTVKVEKIPLLSPVFSKSGTITAANSSSIADGAAALILMGEKKMRDLQVKPLAKIIGHSSSAKNPHDFSTAPIDAIQKLLKKINWKIEEVDLFEINEAFAVVALAAMKSLNIPLQKLNVLGGACVLGHPIGASGARIIMSLISALRHFNLKRGVASLCIGGGEATAIALEV